MYIFGWLVSYSIKCQSDSKQVWNYKSNIYILHNLLQCDYNDFRYYKYLTIYVNNLYNLVPLNHIVPSNNRQRNLKQRGPFRVESCCTCLIFNGGLFNKYVIIGGRGYSKRRIKVGYKIYLFTILFCWLHHGVHLLLQQAPITHVHVSQDTCIY